MGYAFDIHCNSYVPFFMLAYIAQFCLLPVLNSESATAAFFANMLYALAFSAYFYVTHLGYRALPFLTRTEFYLYPMVTVFVLFAVSIALLPFGVKINATRVCLSWHFAST